MKVSAKKMREKLREKHIFNSFQLAGHGNVYITKQNQDRGRWSQPAKYVVVRPGFITNSSAPWYDSGCKVFTIRGRDEEKGCLEEAQEWASKKYNIEEWGKTPFGTWMDSKVLSKRLKEIGVTDDRKGN